MKNKSFDDYLREAKEDTWLYSIISIVILIILLIISIIYSFYYILIFYTFFGILLLGKFQAYNNLKIIKNYLDENNLLEMIGKIDFWNDEYYFLTENYMIIIESKKVHCFKYEEICELEKTINYLNSARGDYLKIILNDGREFNILIFSSDLVNEKFKDISSYLIEKNKNIKLKDDIVRF